MSNVSVEQRKLTLHENIIYKIIYDQAGTLDKGILEGIMNAREAGSEEVRISCHNDGRLLVIEDDGRGFRSEAEILEWFEKFGTPHEQSENKVWARFRIGRGQLFAFGKNKWRTGEFCMVVDVKNNGVDYELQYGLPHHQGCRIEIELYQPMIGEGSCPYHSYDAFKSAVKNQIEFMEGVIKVDGEQVNTPASTLKWDVETDECYFMFGKGAALEWYNMGAFVRNESARLAGVCGVVVSKVPFDVNFARNQVKESCEVYQRARAIVKIHKKKEIRRSHTMLTDDQRVSSLLDMRDDEVEYDEVKNLGMLYLCNGRVMSLEAAKRICSPWTFAPKNDRTADMLIQSERAICFSDEIMATLDYSGDERDFFKWLMKGAFRNFTPSTHNQWLSLSKLWRPFNELAGGYSTEHLLLPSTKLTKAERRFIKVMQRLNVTKPRTICLGVSDTANGWTDGETYIAIERSYLKHHFPSTAWGAAAIMTLIYHELAHDTDDTGSDIHGLEFYRRYHDLTRGTALFHIASLAYAMRSQKNEDYHEEVANKEAKKQSQRDARLAVKKAKKAKKVEEKVAVEVVEADEDEKNMGIKHRVPQQRRVRKIRRIYS